MKNRLIIFDCFGVIFSEIAPIFFERHFTKDEAVFLKEKFFVPADLGLVTYDELFENMSEELHMPKNEILDEWNSLIILNEEIIPVIKKLREDNDVILLSNAPLGFVEKLFDEYSLTDLFDRMFISCNIGLSKPDEAAYLHCVSQMNRKYDKIYMIDDNLSNLEHLEKIGITPIHFRSICSLNELMQ